MQIIATSITIDKIGVVYVLDDKGRAWRKSEMDRTWERYILPDLDNNGNIKE